MYFETPKNHAQTQNEVTLFRQTCTSGHFSILFQSQMCLGCKQHCIGELYNVSAYGILFCVFLGLISPFVGIVLPCKQPKWLTSLSTLPLQHNRRCTLSRDTTARCNWLQLCLLTMMCPHMSTILTQFGWPSCSLLNTAWQLLTAGSTLVSDW